MNGDSNPRYPQSKSNTLDWILSTCCKKPSASRRDFAHTKGSFNHSFLFIAAACFAWCLDGVGPLTPVTAFLVHTRAFWGRGSTGSNSLFHITESKQTRDMDRYTTEHSETKSVFLCTLKPRFLHECLKYSPVL